MATDISRWFKTAVAYFGLSGEYVWVECKGSVIRDAKGNPKIFAGLMTRIDGQSKYDTLTGLLTTQELHYFDFTSQAGTAYASLEMCKRLGYDSIIEGVETKKNNVYFVVLSYDVTDGSFSHYYLFTVCFLISGNIHFIVLFHYANVLQD